MDVKAEWNSYRSRIKAEPDPDGVSDDENTPIVLVAVVDRCGRQKQFRHLAVASCPAYVWLWVFDRERYLPLETIKNLAENGHDFSIQTKYVETPFLEWSL